MDIFEAEVYAIAAAENARIPIDGRLEVDTYNTLTYGNNFNGNTDADGIMSFHFDADGDALTLNLDGYDIDAANEVAVLVNAQFVGFLDVTENNELGFSQLEIDAGLVDAGTNTLTFVQTGDPALTWGVTDLFLAGPGLHELPFYYDPEFTEDGWVAWQTDHDGFYLGRMDLDTGGFLGVVNHLAIPPTTWFETVQAVELIRTPDGVAAIGMTAQGLVYLSETEGYVLEGTEGMHFNAMPKGETPTLRFICADENNLQYLYDDGELTLLPPKIGQAWQWLNEDEVLMRSNITDVLSVLNVETGELDFVTDQAYGRGGAAAITTTTGEQMITMQGDGFRDIYTKTEQGWEMTQRITSPLGAGDQHFSPEFFEWHGRVWLLGYVSPEDVIDWTAPTAIVLYDIDNDLWVRVSHVDAWKDPEVLVLNDGSLAWYADDTSVTKQLFNTISYEQAMTRGIITELLARITGRVGHVDEQTVAAGDLTAADAGIAPYTPAITEAWRTNFSHLHHEPAAEPAAAAPALLTSFGKADAFDFVARAPHLAADVQPDAPVPAGEVIAAPARPAFSDRGWARR